jgi:phosphohistidine swiveling domain-containing protein
MKKDNWILYLERKQPLYLFASMINAYGQILLSEVGFGFEYQLFYFKGDTGEFWRKQSEMEKADEFFLDIINTRKEFFLSHIEKAKEYTILGHDLIERYKLVNENKLNENVLKSDQSLTEKVILYCTVLPYRYLSAINSSIESGVSRDIYEREIELLEPLRQISCYPDFVLHIYPKIWNFFGNKYNLKNKELISCALPSELFAAAPCFNEEILRQRHSGCMFELVDERILFIYDNSKIESIRGSIISPEIKKIKGSVAQKGLAQGRVSIVNSVEDMVKVKDGDVIVSINTNPSLMPAIILCSAIVTDEGGIMCHASVVARELKKPCIIGTKIATKVLKDGDLVEVDAEKGVVTILKKSNEK